jgi:hypothetical protein
LEYEGEFSCFEQFRFLSRRCLPEDISHQ